MVKTNFNLKISKNGQMLKQPAPIGYLHPRYAKDQYLHNWNDTYIMGLIEEQ